jgi:2-polyprenyl-6-methoxyphenol hydroxylase-like FAD-dependent oxidoreductase
MNDVVIAGAGPNGLMLAGELGLAGMRPVVLEPLAGPNPQRRANGITGQAVRLLDHRGLYSVLAGTPDPPQPSPWAMFAAMALDLTAVPNPQHFMFPVQQPRLVQTLAQRVDDLGADLRWGHRLVGFDQHADGVVVHVDGPDGPYELPAKYLVGADGGPVRRANSPASTFPE